MDQTKQIQSGNQTPDITKGGYKGLLDNLYRHEPCDVVRVQVDALNDWDCYVSSHQDGTIFHGSAWIRSLVSSYRHEPVLLKAIRDDKIVGLVPLFFVNSLLNGKMLISVPNAVGGGIIADDSAAVSTLAQASVTYARENKCKSVQMRSTFPVINQWEVDDRYYGFMKQLPGKGEDVLAWLPRKARAAARNGKNKFGLQAEWGVEHLKTVYQLYIASMKRLGSINYPFSFFKQLVSEFNKENENAWVTCVYDNDRPVAGLVTFVTEKMVCPYLVGFSNDASSKSASNFLYYSVMQRACDQGIKYFDFGRSRKDNTGSVNFKRFNGFEPFPLGYQTFSLTGKTHNQLTPSSPKIRLARLIWKKLPTSITHRAGSILSHHIPG